MLHPLKPLKTIDEFSPNLVPNLLYRVRALKTIIGEMGDYLQGVQETLPEGSPQKTEIELFLGQILQDLKTLE